ncbi:MAG: hypothetical protein ACI4RA_06480 [Kiritimatiellia bacterium]
MKTLRSLEWVTALAVCASAAVCAAAGAAPAPCRVRVVDAENGWPVPLVILETTHALVHVTDNAGVVAVDAPELMGRETWFSVKSHGYGVDPDGFGSVGVRITPRAGEEVVVKVKRRQLARRLGRLSGGGLFAESQKCGEWLGAAENGEFGRDSAQTAPYRDGIFWLWGDTSMQSYPLGVFNVTAATSPAPAFPRAVPPILPRYRSFNEKGTMRPRGVIPRQGQGPIWIFGLVSLRDRQGEEHLCGAWSQIKEFCTPEKTGLCEWDAASESFRVVRTVWTRTKESPKATVIPDGTACRYVDEAGRKWVLFGNPFPFLRMPDAYEAYLDPAQWEEVPRVGELVAEDGSRVMPASGQIAWSAYRRRFVAVLQQKFGKPSGFGEVWYAESATPYGPWTNVVKIATHDNYAFYNPILHMEGESERNADYLLFEGTYSDAFANHPPRTPRWNYTQVLYRLDFKDIPKTR